MWVTTCSRRLPRLVTPCVCSNAMIKQQQVIGIQQTRRGYANEFGSYDNPPNYDNGEMMSAEAPKKERRPRILYLY